MATQVPAPILDLRNGDLVAAQAIAALPPELSDRSNSNPAVVLIEAAGFVLDKLLFQINRWPQAVIQKALALVGIVQNPAIGATVQQTFTLSQPQPLDTAIPVGALVSSADGSITFAATAAITIKAFAAQTGTVTITAGSTTVIGSGTSFVTDGSWAGQQIQGASGAWYTIASVSSSAALTLASSALTTQSAVAFNVGPISGVTAAQCTTTGSATNVAAGSLTNPQTVPAGVASTSNGAAATGGADLETVAAAVARAATAFAARDVACTTSDYSYFATQVLGQNSRAAALANYNGTTPQVGTVSIAMLSPAWTSTTPVSASERAAVIRDLVGRTASGTTNADLAVAITSYTPAAVVYRRNAYSSATAQVSCGIALNNYLNPNTYPLGQGAFGSGARPIFASDLAGVLEVLPQVDRVLSVNGVLAVSTAMIVTANSITFTNNSATASCNAADVGAGKIVANQTFLIDPNSGGTSAYLVTAIGGGSTSLTLDHAFAGATVTSTTTFLNAGDTPLSSWLTLPFSNLSVSTSSPPSTIVVMGAV